MWREERIYVVATKALVARQYLVFLISYKVMGLITDKIM